MTKETRNRMMFLLIKVAAVNENTPYSAVFRLGKREFEVYVDDEYGDTKMFEMVNDLSEEKTYDIFQKLDEIEFSATKQETSITKGEQK